MSERKLLLTVEEAAERLSLGRTLVYDLVMRKQITSLKVGRARRIPVTALDEFVTHELGQTATERYEQPERKEGDHGKQTWQ